MSYFNGFKFTGNLSPYIALLLLLIYCLLYCSTASISNPVQWMMLPSIYVCVYEKINGVTSISTQNKSHTTYLYLPSIILYVTHTINTHKLYILYICMNMYITLIFYTFNLIHTYYINVY